MKEKSLLGIGDPLPSFYYDKKLGIAISEKATVLEIHDLPESEEEARKLVNLIFDKYHEMGRTCVSVISGENLADDPKVANLVDASKVYVIEK
ncbi:hypothetical protein ACFL0F_00165 [Patescibacteria group bacterium]